MGKKLYYSDVTHKCGHTVRYEFTLPNDFSRRKKETTRRQHQKKMSDLASLAEYDCNDCEEKKES